MHGGTFSDNTCNGNSNDNKRNENVPAASNPTIKILAGFVVLNPWNRSYSLDKNNPISTASCLPLFRSLSSDLI